MGGGTDDWVTNGAADTIEDGIAAEVEAYVVQARAAGDMVAVQSLVGRLAESPGIDAARISVFPSPGDDLFASVMARLPRENPAEVVRQIGPDGWRLELRVAFGDPERYVRFRGVVEELGDAADRAMRRPCRNLDRFPGSGHTMDIHTSICSSSPEVIIAVDPRNGWAAMSGAYASILGYPESGWRPERLLDLIHADDQAAAVSSFVASCSAGAPRQSTDLRVRAADGQWRVFEVVARQVVGTDGLPTVVFYGSDITSSRQRTLLATEDNARMATLIETLEDGVVVCDEAGRIRLVNGAGRRLLRLDEGPVPDVPALLASLEPTVAEPASALPRLERLLGSAEALSEGELEFVDGRVCGLHVVPIARAGWRLGTLLRCVDITQRVVARRQGALPVAATGGRPANQRAVAEATALNHEFVSTVVHELRGPLSSVVAFSCLLGEPGEGELTETQRGHLSVIERNADRLLRLIGDLLLLSRLEARTLRCQLSPASLKDLLGAAVIEYQPVALSAGIALDHAMGDGPDISIDSSRIYHVIANLLDNALRFTPRGGRITVRSRYDRDSWTIVVEDTGIGIPATEVPKLFSAFHRGASPALTGRSVSPGTGLGLAICRAIVELHHGTIQVASTEETGTRVTVSLPMHDVTSETQTSIGG